MKVEYEFFTDEPSLFVNGAGFLEALNNEYELDLLRTAVEGYAAVMGIDAHFGKEANDVVASWLSKSSKVIYTVKRRYVGKIPTESWGEVYVINSNAPVRVIFKEPGDRSYVIRRKQNAKIGK